jgi:hypothetical protein
MKIAMLRDAHSLKYAFPPHQLLTHRRPGNQVGQPENAK